MERHSKNSYRKHIMFCIIVPIKNQFKIVKMCIESIVKYYANQEIVLIDDGSTEQNLVYYLNEIHKKFNWKLFRNGSSVGHTKACESGIENSTSENIFLLNSDTILTKNSLELLSDTLDKNKDIAVVGPKTSSASGPQLSLEAFTNRFKWSIDEIEEYARQNELLNNEILDIELVNGFCLGMRRSIFNQVGGFDENLSCYGNEKELLLRIRKAGHRTVFVTKSYVHHFGKMSYSQEKNINIGKAQRDADCYIMKKHLSTGK